MRSTCLMIVLATLVFGCQKSTNENKTPPPGSGSALPQPTPGSGALAERPTPGSGSAAAIPKPPPEPEADIDSRDILGRTEEAKTEVYVKHILVAWKALDATVYRGRIDERAKNRSNADAAKLAQELAGKLKAAKTPAEIDELVKTNSEDPGSAKTGEPYEVTKDSQFVPEFKNLALKLKEGEVGIVKTMFGYHVMIRVPAPPPDPLESTDILKRPPVADKSVLVKHILISWKDSPAANDERAKKRTKAEADKLAKDLLAKVRAKGDMDKLMKEHSEDPGSKDTGRAYDVTADSRMVEPFKKLSLRLKMNEAGLVKTLFGWHIIKRVEPPPPPPPDSLDSVDILKREPPEAKVKVKHILLSWKELQRPGKDPRGEKRTRAELETLVKDTVAKLKKGDPIEPLMKELSEDPGSAQSGMAYDATPDAGLVAPFKNLSLRLKKDEVGVVKTQFGVHIIKRVE